MEEKTPLSGRWESAKGNQQVFRRVGPSPLGGHSLHKKDLQSSLLLPDLVLFLAALMLAEAIHSTLLHDWSKDKISNRKSDRVCRAHWVVLKKSEKTMTSSFPRTKGSWKGSMALNGSFVSWSALFNTLCRVFCRGAA